MHRVDLASQEMSAVEFDGRDAAACLSTCRFDCVKLHYGGGVWIRPWMPALVDAFGKKSRVRRFMLSPLGSFGSLGLRPLHSVRCPVEGSRPENQRVTINSATCVHRWFVLIFVGKGSRQVLACGPQIACRTD